MPKARGNDWRGHPVPQTPLQRAAYLDVCVRWLVQEPSAESRAGDALETMTRLPLGWGGEEEEAEEEGRPIAHSDADLQLAVFRSSRCSFCSGPRAEAVVANPFAHRAFVLACGPCRKKGEAK